MRAAVERVKNVENDHKFLFEKKTRKLKDLAFENDTETISSLSQKNTFSLLKSCQLGYRS